jgi:hypothetical protein
MLRSHWYMGAVCPVDREASTEIIEICFYIGICHKYVSLGVCNFYNLRYHVFIIVLDQLL